MKKALCGLCIVAVTSACVPRGIQRRSEPAPTPPRTSTRVILLGTGTPNADPDRSGPAVAVVAGGQAYLVDCGPGVVRRAAAAARAGTIALETPKLTRLFITHLHSDHTLGYADLIFTPWVLGRAEPLIVYGPPGTARMTEHLLKAYSADIRIRREGLEPANDGGYRVEVHEIGPGRVYKDERVTVTAFRVSHGSWEHAFGFRFDTSDRSIVISGDTTPSENLVRHARGCDILIHEVYSHRALPSRPPVWQRYHRHFHTSSRELATLAKRIQPQLLVLYHQLLWGTTESDLLNDMQLIYDGRVVSGTDLDVY